jgi:hypothetical protein
VVPGGKGNIQGAEISQRIPEKNGQIFPAFSKVMPIGRAHGKRAVITFEKAGKR